MSHGIGTGIGSFVATHPEVLDSSLKGAPSVTSGLSKYGGNMVDGINRIYKVGVRDALNMAKRYYEPIVSNWKTLGIVGAAFGIVTIVATASRSVVGFMQVQREYERYSPAIEKLAEAGTSTKEIELQIEGYPISDAAKYRLFQNLVNED